MGARRRSALAGSALVLAAAGAFSWWLLRADVPPVPTGPSIFERADQVAAPDANRPSARVIPQDDLPPAGTRSLFDHLVAQNGSLPYPFDALVDMLQQQAPPGREPVRLMIPLGRSLLKAQADFRHPRVLAALDYQAANTPASLGVAVRGQLFLGFVENAREIEVISYNEAAGRYEFQLVQDYAADGARRIVYARRAVCMTCHQGGSPIFPQRPWNETNAQPEVAARISEARGGDAPYLGVPLQVALGAPERFDELTDIGAFAVATQQVWLDGCGEGGAACRRLLLKLALRYAYDPGAFNPNAPEVATLGELQRAHWPADGIVVPQSDLHNRDPLAERRGLRQFFGALLSPEHSGAGARSNEDLAAFDRLPKLPAELDPLSPRPPKRVLRMPTLDGVFGIAAQFTPDDLRALEAQDDHAWSRVEARVDALPDALFAAAPFSRVRTLQALLAPVPGYCCLDVSELSPPVAVSVPPLALTASSPLQPFARYCFGCHRGNPNARLDFMAGADEAEVADNIRARPEIRDALDWTRYRGTDKAGKLMPPADSAERARLEEDLRQSPQLLEQMREQVPGLFDF